MGIDLNLESILILCVSRPKAKAAAPASAIGFEVPSHLASSAPVGLVNVRQASLLNASSCLKSAHILLELPSVAFLVKFRVVMPRRLS